jgi:PAS domain S-box-containing protein
MSKMTTIIKIFKKIMKFINCPVFMTRDGMRRAKLARKQKAQDWARIQSLVGKLDTARQQLRIYKEFWDYSPDAFLLISCPDGAILDANPAACSLYGYEHEDVTSLNLADISAEHASTRAVWANRLTYIPIRLHKNSDGRKILVTATVSYFTGQDRMVAACIIRPIINQQRALEIVGDVDSGYDRYKLDQPPLTETSADVTDNYSYHLKHA